MSNRFATWAAIAAALLAVPCPLAYAQVVSPRQLVEVVDFNSPVVSPDGSKVAFRLELASIERNTHETVWYVQRMQGGSVPRRVAEGGVPLRESWGLPSPSPAVWSPDGRWIYFRALFDDRIDVWRAAADGSEASPITLEPSDVREFSLSADGQLLRYAVGPTREAVKLAELEEYLGGIRIDDSVPIGQGLFRSGRLQGKPETQRLRDNEVIRYPLLADTPDRWRQIDLATGERSELATAEFPVQPLSAADLEAEIPGTWKLAHDRRSGRVALLTRRQPPAGLQTSPHAELSMLPGGNAPPAMRCVDEACAMQPITGIQWRPASDEVVFTITDPERSQAQSIFRWNVKTGRVHRVVRSRGLLNGGRDTHSPCGISHAALACVAAEASVPPRLERVDLETGAREILFDPNKLLAMDMTGVDVRPLKWKDAQGQEFNGLYYPAARSSGGPPPLFVTYYRCSGFVRGGVGDEWPLATLAGLGISALCISAAPSRIDAVERYDLGLSAVESAIDVLSDRGEIDRARVGMGGLSFGSEVTLWTVMNSDALAAASIASPPMSPLTYLFMSMHGDAFESRLQEFWQLGRPDETVERWETISPMFNLERMRVPILMQMPEQEYLHATDHAIPLLRDQRADLYVYPNEAHQKFQPRHKLSVYERNLDWFRFWLQDVERSDRGRAEQYERWREMRARVADLLGASTHGRSQD
ncbi:Atxe2 family lasso peptide isopeptidase [Luteimonas sp. R10]|uniref:Atxe2 family lasso peptide isopeptidase n=1 Tax=Luteimonas sp. R10 TaxID=3108176 RepID=UPI003093028C|nr:Atxe2 family lasso peptide isopeptidase [Luteimonas sp. R10]